MRIKKRSAVILALAAAGALAVVGIALAAAHSTVGFSFTPGNVPKTTFQKGELFVHTHTNYSNPGNSNPGGATQRATLNFDDDFRVKPSAVPKCTPTGGDLAHAMAQCARARIGKGRATATANGAFTIHGCVLAFNGKRSGGRPTVRLFTRVDVSAPSSIHCGHPRRNHGGNATVILKGVIKPSPLAGDFGKQVDFKHITSAAAFPLTDFRVHIRKGNYISARCHDGNHKWNMRTKFTYNNGTKETVRSARTCS
jgi:hypothetical protein